MTSLNFEFFDAKIILIFLFAILKIPLYDFAYRIIWGNAQRICQFLDLLSHFLIQFDMHIYFLFTKSIKALFASSTFFSLYSM